MKRFYLATPTKYEDQVIEDLGALGAAQLISDYTVGGFKKVDTVEKCEKYVKLQQRMTSILSSLPPEKPSKKDSVQALKPVSAGSTPASAPTRIPSLDEIESSVHEVETVLDSRLAKLENHRSELKTLKATEEKLQTLQKHGLRTDAFGDFQSIFVKAGFMNRALSLKLPKYVEGTSVRFAKWPDRREEDFVVVLGLNQDKPLVEETLVRLNFAELTLPTGVPSDPAQALVQNRDSTSKMEEEISGLENEVRNICQEFQTKGAGYEPVVRRALNVENARSTFSRTGTMSLVNGWIPVKYEESLRNTVTASTNGAVFMKFEKPEADEQVPSYINHHGVAGAFDLFTKLRGLPLYGEIDPTLIVTVLFTVMYGMMFGDIGQGAVLLAMGLTFKRMRRSFLGIPARGMVKLGGILATCGVSSIFFGVLYGEFFLTEAFHPIFVNPIQGQTTIIIVALLFGVGQLTFGLILKLINLIRAKLMIEAAFGGVRLLYYITGVILAVKYVGTLSFAVFAQNLPLTLLALGCLGILFLSPTIEAAIKHELKIGEDIMKGGSEFIEIFLSYLTNSISYVRLAAFAIAHSALGIAALILATSIGLVPALIFMNFLAMTIEALGVFIQCMRLTYYEFFTRFYSGTGVPYRPFSLPKILGTVN